VKAGDLERNISHLVEVAKAARACLATVEGEVTALRLELHGDVPETSAVAPSSGAERSAFPMGAVYK
jgi:hypothetical protein